MLNETPKVVDETTIQQAEELIANLQKKALETELAEVKARAEKAEAENAQFKEKEVMELKRGEESLKKVAAMSTVTPTKTNAMNNIKTQKQMMAAKLACAFAMQNGSNQEAVQMWNEVKNNDVVVDTKNSVGYVSTSSSIQVQAQNAQYANNVDIFQNATKVDIGQDDNVTVTRLVRDIEELDYTTSTSDINRAAFDNKHSIVVQKSAAVSEIRSEMSLERKALDNKSIEKVYQILEPEAVRFQDDIDNKIIQNRLYNVDGLDIDPLIPTLNDTFLQKNHIVLVTDEALKSTNGNNPAVTLFNMANAKKDKRGYFVRPLGFDSFDSTDFNTEKLLNSLHYAMTLLKTNTRNQRLQLFIGNAMYAKLAIQRSFDGTGSRSNVFINNIQTIENMGIQVNWLTNMQEGGGTVPCAILADIGNYYIKEASSEYKSFIESSSSIKFNDLEIERNNRTLASGKILEEYVAKSKNRIVSSIYDSTAAVLFTLAN